MAGDVVVTALKPAEDGRGAILRAVNAAAGASAVTIDGDAIATAIPLDETPLDEAPGWARPNELRPGEIRTRRPTGA